MVVKEESYIPDTEDKSSTLLNLISESQEEDDLEFEKIAIKMVDLYKQMEIEHFFKVYSNCLMICFLEDEETTADNVIKLLAYFVVTLSKNDNVESHKFMEMLMNVLRESLSDPTLPVRRKSCQFLAALTKGLDDISNKTFDDIYSMMKEILTEENPYIRIDAARVLYRLQDSSDPKCPVVKLFYEHVLNDPSSTVRKTLVRMVAVTKQKMGRLISVTRDRNKKVRKAAYEVMKTVPCFFLTTMQRTHLISNGLADTCRSVRKEVKNGLVKTWIQSFEVNHLRLIGSLDVQRKSSESVDLILDAIFEMSDANSLSNDLGKYLNKDRLIPFDDLLVQTALYWKHFLTFYADSMNKVVRYFDIPETDEMIADGTPVTLLPELIPFCKYIKEYYLDASSRGKELQWQRTEREIILIQLLRICELCNFSNEIGRLTLDELLRQLLLSDDLENSSIKPIIRLYSSTNPDQNVFILKIIHIVYDLCCRKAKETHDSPMDEETLMSLQEEPSSYDDSPPDSPQKEKPNKALSGSSIVQLDSPLNDSDCDFKINPQSNQVSRDDGNHKFHNGIGTAQTQEEFTVNPKYRSAKTDLLLFQMGFLIRRAEKGETIEEHVSLVVKNAPDDKVLKGIHIIYEMMQLNITKLTLPLRALFNEFVMSVCWKYRTDPEVMPICTMTMCSFCLRDFVLAKEHMNTIGFSTRHNLVMAVKCLFDLFLRYDSKDLPLPDAYEELEHDTSTSTLGDTSEDYELHPTLSTLIKLSDHPEDMKLREECILGICKLFLARKIRSPTALSNVFIFYAYPVVGKRARSSPGLRAKIPMFIRMFVKDADYAFGVSAKAFIIAIKDVVETNEGSLPDDANLKKFLALTTNLINQIASHCKNEECRDTVLLELVLDICKEVEENELLNARKSYLTAITLLDISEISSSKFPIFDNQVKRFCKMFIHCDDAVVINAVAKLTRKVDVYKGVVPRKDTSQENEAKNQEVQCNGNSNSNKMNGDHSGDSDDDGVNMSNGDNYNSEDDSTDSDEDGVNGKHKGDSSDSDEFDSIYSDEDGVNGKDKSDSSDSDELDSIYSDEDGVNGKDKDDTSDSDENDTSGSLEDGASDSDVDIAKDDGSDSDEDGACDSDVDIAKDDGSDSDEDGASDESDLDEDGTNGKDKNDEDGASNSDVDMVKDEGSDMDEDESGSNEYDMKDLEKNVSCCSDN